MLYLYLVEVGKVPKKNVVVVKKIHLMLLFYPKALEWTKTVGSIYIYWVPDFISSRYLCAVDRYRSLVSSRFNLLQFVQFTLVFHSARNLFLLIQSPYTSKKVRLDLIYNSPSGMNSLQTKTNNVSEVMCNLVKL